MLQNPHVLVTLQWMHNPLHLPHTKQRLNVQNVSETPQFLTLLTSKCASRHNAVHFFDISTSKKCSETAQFLTHFTSKCASCHNAVHFFDISTSKSAPRPTVFNTFYFQMCFAPQRRALFQHLNFQSGPTLRCFLPFHFEIGFAPQRRATFHLSSPQMTRCLRTRRFSEPTFQPSRATKPRKNTVFRDFPTFSRTCIFFLLIFSLLTLLPADCFFTSPYCRKFDF